MQKNQQDMKLNDEQLENVSGGRFFACTGNAEAIEDAKDSENPQIRTCKDYVWGANNYIGTRVMNTCSSCDYFTMGNTRMYCNQPQQNGGF